MSIYRVVTKAYVLKVLAVMATLENWVTDIFM